MTGTHYYHTELVIFLFFERGFLCSFRAFKFLFLTVYTCIYIQHTHFVLITSYLLLPLSHWLPLPNFLLVCGLLQLLDIYISMSTGGGYLPEQGNLLKS